MKVRDLIESLASIDDNLDVRVFNIDGDYATPVLTLVYKSGRPDALLIEAEGDD